MENHKLHGLKIIDVVNELLEMSEEKKWFEVTTITTNGKGGSKFGTLKIPLSNDGGLSLSLSLLSLSSSLSLLSLSSSSIPFQQQGRLDYSLLFFLPRSWKMEFIFAKPLRSMTLRFCFSFPSLLP
jgi:hypothetical protein